jgi:dTDP-glucose 4,6-dehydratase
MKRILVTGGAGFIGSNFIRYMLNNYPYDIINADSLTYAGNLENLKDLAVYGNYKFFKADISDAKAMEPLIKQSDAVINFAAETHVDRSIIEPDKFIKTNIMGTHTLLELAKLYKAKRYVQISTDEVYGSLGENGYFTEDTPLDPNSPYSASKAAADLLVFAYHKTYGMDVCITRCSNNYGPYQFPEKLIPLMIINALDDKRLPVYGDGLNIRDWLYVYDHCSAVDLVLHRGNAGGVYNIGGNNERKNIDIVKRVLKELNKPDTLIEFVKDRLGHDRRYAIDSSKIKNELGWVPAYSFDTALKSTIDWYVNNKDWWENVMTGEYKKYYNRIYGEQ